MWQLHFMKRIFESAFVHKFSRSHMPRTFLVRACAYHSLFAFLIGYSLCYPGFIVGILVLPLRIVLLAWALAEACNFYFHCRLRDMRRGKEWVQATEWPFSSILCPNYTTEIVCWMCFSLTCGLLSSYAFTVAGWMVMSARASRKNERSSRRENGVPNRNLLGFPPGDAPFIYSILDFTRDKGPAEWRCQ